MLVPAAASAALVALSWLAQAEPAPAEEPISPAPTSPAPPSPAPAAAELTPRQPLHAIAVHGRFAYRPNDSGSGIPTEGFSLGGTFERRYGLVGNVLGLGVGLDFFFDRFSSGDRQQTDGTQVNPFARQLSQTSFVALQTIALERLPVRPWLAAGGGVSLGAGTRPVARGAAGVELGLTRATAIAVRADLTHPLSDAGAYGDILDVGLGFLQRF